MEKFTVVVEIEAKNATLAAAAVASSMKSRKDRLVSVSVDGDSIDLEAFYSI